MKGGPKGLGGGSWLASFSATQGSRVSLEISKTYRRYSRIISREWTLDC